jgi:hypothetical protein
MNRATLVRHYVDRLAVVAGGGDPGPVATAGAPST